MKKTHRKIIWLGTKEVLLTMFDLSLPFFYAEKSYRRRVLNYQRWRESDKIKTKRSIKYLIQKGYIDSFVENKQVYIELTPKGVMYLSNQSLKDLTIAKQSLWDGKWRLVVFDIPEKLRFERNVLRRKLYDFGFYKIQKSVYVFPYNCTKEIKYICERLNIHEYVLVAISELIQNEEGIIAHFIENKIIPISGLKK
ncbi:MAG: repressor in the phenylacetic acid catabolism [Berkelbacteria bacterium GW2011_GWA2_35_9]|uniref:CRISPR-associated endoribonuclease Cas2 n=1 Tax=Berkelbacteria bacterium GW2011_GWA2_35_9 TaxID=1618333 RepID=A0A0G0D697_9BACT|nr:MAG: repressor in the phenylacetic acid catabolism [Berkelbacteria bacterium GW2011_GWA2_35_9]